MSDRRQLVSLCDQLLQPALFKDYCPNGLQVEGRAKVSKIISGVTASQALIEAAIHAGADTLLVHHGLFWRGQDGSVTGWLKKRLALLMHHDINLLAYHLPLDAHKALGNNAQLGLFMGWEALGQFGDQQLGWLGQPPETDQEPQAFANALQTRLGRAPLSVIPEPDRRFKRIAWCTGAAQSWFEAAIAAGADAFVTGEISEPQAHLAKETGVAFFACGHHATERYGAPALATYVATELGLSHAFIDIDNPA
ncbi:MAG: Nif3-like dinuclear metal center hexameric protein [Betaproteobacteria bacterium]|nr:Nif3-like dinuclear metal center hexameric protein [Betaproteobacteria bacterium]